MALSIFPQDALSLTRPVLQGQRHEITLSNSDEKDGIAYRISANPLLDAARYPQEVYEFSPAEGFILPHGCAVVEISVRGLETEAPSGGNCAGIIVIETIRIEIGSETQIQNLLRQGWQPPSTRYLLPVIVLGEKPAEDGPTWLTRVIDVHLRTGRSIPRPLSRLPTVHDKPIATALPSPPSTASTHRLHGSSPYFEEGDQLLSPVPGPPSEPERNALCLGITVPVDVLAPFVSDSTPETVPVCGSPSAAEPLSLFVPESSVRPLEFLTGLGVAAVESWRASTLTMHGDGKEGSGPVAEDRTVTDHPEDSSDEHESQPLSDEEALHRAQLAHAHAEKEELKAQLLRLQRLISDAPESSTHSAPLVRSALPTTLSHAAGGADHYNQDAKTALTKASSGIMGPGYYFGRGLKAFGGFVLRSLEPIEVHGRLHRLRDIVEQLEEHLKVRGDVVLTVYLLYARPDLLRKEEVQNAESSSSAIELPTWGMIKPLRNELRVMLTNHVSDARKKANILMFAEIHHSEKAQAEAHSLDGRLGRIKACLTDLMAMCREMKEGTVHAPRPFLFDLLGTTYVFPLYSDEFKKHSSPPNTDVVQPLRQRAYLTYHRASEKLVALKSTDRHEQGDQSDHSFDLITGLFTHVEREREYVEAVASVVEWKIQSTHSTGRRFSVSSAKSFHSRTSSLDSGADSYGGEPLDVTLPNKIRRYFDVRGRFGEEHTWHLRALCETASMALGESPDSPHPSSPALHPHGSDELSETIDYLGGLSPESARHRSDTIAGPPRMLAHSQSEFDESIRLRIVPRSLGRLLNGESLATVSRLDIFPAM